MVEDAKPAVARIFENHNGQVVQIPEVAVLYEEPVVYAGEFIIRLTVEVFLRYWPIASDIGADSYYATILAEDLHGRKPDEADYQKENPKRCCARSCIQQEFNKIDALVAWLMSSDLEDAIRKGIVKHPPTPVPSPEHRLKKALVLHFAAKLEAIAPQLAEGLKQRKALSESHNKSHGRI